MKKYKVLYYVTTVMSMLVGLWHFFVPVMFQWYDYLPMQYKNLIVGIDYTNYCFSLLLFPLGLRSRGIDREGSRRVRDHRGGWGDHLRRALLSAGKEPGLKHRIKWTRGTE